MTDEAAARLRAAVSDGAAPEAIAELLDRLLVPGAERFDRREAARRARVPLERAVAFWRAMGFVDVGDGEEIFTEVDAEMLRRAVAVADAGWGDTDMALQMTRVMGQAASRVAASQVDTALSRTGQTPAEAISLKLLDELETFLAYIWRRHLAATAERAVLQVSDGSEAVVGFADLVGFTAASHRMDADELARVVARFETLAYDAVGDLGGRVVKMIGDEVMFAATGAAQGAETALRLAETFAGDEALPDVRVGLAAGEVVAHQGDLFGRAPNLASRLVDTAFPGTVLVSDEVREAVSDEAGYTWRQVGPQRLKGFGRLRFWVLRRADGYDGGG
jgi:adenylate cyclase